MPLGGLKWKDELEGELERKEFKKIKSEVQLLGIDDAPFSRDDKSVKIVAVLSRGGKMLEGVFHSEIKKDGLDATNRIIQLVKDIKRENARAILLDGVTYGGFNTVDIQRVYKETNIPVIVSLTKRPDHAKINDALRNLSDRELRTNMIRAAGKLYEVELDSERTAFMQIVGISQKDAEGILKVATVNGLVPEPLRAAHMIGKGAYGEAIHNELIVEDPPHVKAYLYIKHKHKQVKRLKKRYFPGAAGEVASFLFAFLIAWLVIQGLGWALVTATPLVVVESESMVHTSDAWQLWLSGQGVSTKDFGFDGGMNVGDIIIAKGDNPQDIQLGDVIIYSRYDPTSLGGEPIIHRVVGIADISGDMVTVGGAIKYEGQKITVPCNDEMGYTVSDLRNIYSNEALARLYPHMDFNDFRIFFTKGDNNNVEDQCPAGNSVYTPAVSFPVREDLVVGRAKVDIPYLGYVKLGLVCAGRYATGSACSCRCWWASSNPKCCK